MTADSVTVRCAVCGESDAQELLSKCFNCGNDYHLNPYSNREGKDCGDAVLGDAMGVHYFCQHCLEEEDSDDAGGQRSSAADEDTASAARTAPPRDPRNRVRRRFRRIDR